MISRKAKPRRGRPPLQNARYASVLVRFSDTEHGALTEALVRDYPVPSRRPSMAAWVRDLMVAHAGQVLGVDVTRGALRGRARGGVADWKRWRLAKAVRRAVARRRRRRSKS